MFLDVMSGLLSRHETDDLSVARHEREAKIVLQNYKRCSLLQSSIDPDSQTLSVALLEHI